MGFSEIKGQKRAVNLLKAGIKRGRISHSYLFYGPDGIGKKTTADVFARAVNCNNPIEGEPCDVCDHCRKSTSGNHPDVVCINPDGQSLKIGQIRNIQGGAYFKCYEGQFKVIMIDDAHLLTTQAANSLLKILEDPPEATVFILLAADTNGLPETILSRCQGIPFSSLDSTVIEEILATKGINLNIPLSAAQGSVGKALDLMAKIDFDVIQKENRQLLTTIKSGGYHDIFKWAENLSKDKDVLDIHLELLATWYRDAAVFIATGEDKALLFSQCDDSTSTYKMKDCIDAQQAIGKLLSCIHSYVNTRLALDGLLLRLRKIERRERG